MPSVTLHMVLAEEVLNAWSRKGAGTPFSVRDGALRHAFLQGAVGPDLGYVPGGDPFLSDLAHTHRTGRLARTLLSSSRTPLERAFAWGWITHVLADAAVHPMIGRASHEVRYGLADGMLPADLDLLTHIRVETGLDAWVHGLYPHLARSRLTPLFDRGSIRFLQSAYEEAYRVRFGSESFLSSHGATARMVSRALSSMGWLGSRPEGGVGSRALRRAVQSSARLTARTLRLRDEALAFLTPVPPALWLCREVTAFVRGFPELVDEVLDDPVRALPDLNLDTGQPEGQVWGHRTAGRALVELKRRREASGLLAAL